MSRRRTWHLARELVLTVGAVLGALCLVLGLVMVATGLSPLIFRSGSMAPAIDTGALALARTVPASDVRRGDVVSVVDAGGSRVTHRVVNVAADGERRQLVLQGDANRTPDHETYVVTEVQRVVLDVPRLGYVVGWVNGPVGLFLLGGYATFLLSVLLRHKDDLGGDAPQPPATGRRKASRRAGSRVPGVLAMSALLAGIGTLTPAPVWAAPWTNPVTVAGTTLTAGAVAAPATFTCGALGVLSVQFNWAAVAGATSYTLHYGSGGALTTTTASTTATIVSAISGGTAWVVANRAFGSVTWTSTASSTRTYTVAVVSLCS